MSDESEQIGQDEIEALLQQAQEAPPTPEAEKPPPEPPDDAAGLDQSEIEALLGGEPGKAQDSPPQPSATPAPPVGVGSPSSAIPPSPAPAREDTMVNREGDIELLFNSAQQALESAAADQGEPPPDVTPFRLQDFAGTPPSTESATLELIRDVELDLRIELGRTHMYLEDVLKLRKGSVVPLDKLAGDPVDIFVNGRLVARGEVLVLNDNFCVRVAELVSGEKVEVA